MKKCRNVIKRFIGLLLCGNCFVITACTNNVVPLPEFPEEWEHPRYGVRWSLSNNKDAGERCFDAVGKIVRIGVGPQDGYSDFDCIYPWSEIKRCVIKTTNSGDVEIIYEGLPGFSLDGSKGDVFVRIPKFCYEHYIKDGYEYRVVSKVGETVHPAFIENGCVLDDIFIAAFEGYVDEDDALWSKEGVIPSSNHTGEYFLNSALRKGENYTLYDNRAVDALYSLMSVEFGLRNSNHYLGYGFADYWQPIFCQSNMVVEDKRNINEVVLSEAGADLERLPEGSNITICKGDQGNIIAQRKITSIKKSNKKVFVRFDGSPIDVDLSCFVGSAACTTNFCESCGTESHLHWHTGGADFIKGSITQNPIRYRWIENIYGSLWHFLPDVTFYNRQMYVCGDMKNYKMFSTEGPYHAVGHLFEINNDNGVTADLYGHNCWIDKFCPDLFPKAIIFGESYNKSLNSTCAYGSYYYLGDDYQIIVNGGGFDHMYRCNILTQRAWVKPDTAWYLYGARLMYKPL